MALAEGHNWLLKLISWPHSLSYSFALCFEFYLMQTFVIRSAVDTILKPDPLSKKQRLRSLKRFTSRIHVADICQALNASIQKPSSG